MSSMVVHVLQSETAELSALSCGDDGDSSYGCTSLCSVGPELSMEESSFFVEEDEMHKSTVPPACPPSPFLPAEQYAPLTPEKYAIGRQSVQAHQQAVLNEFIMNQVKAASVGRHDHYVMLRQLISEAYHRDPHRNENRQHWRKIVAEIGKEYWGAKAIFNYSPDPYQKVLSKLSSMMLWNADVRTWTYQYCETEFDRRRQHQIAALIQLKNEGKLFL